jgi:hypothetical protein
MRLTGSLYIHRKVNGVEQSALGPLNADVLSFQIGAETVKIPDKRRGRRGQNMKVFTDPTSPTGKLTLYSVPPRVMSMLMLGRNHTLAGASGTISGEVLTLEPDYWTDLAHQNVSSVVLNTGVKATLDTGSEPTDTGITWTALAAGAAGNSLTVELLDPLTNGAALAVSVTGTDIAVSLATSALGAIITTAAQILAAIAAHPAAAALVSAADTGTSDGSGVVSAVAKTPLAGGSDTGGTTYVLGRDYEVDALLGKIRSLDGSGITSALASYSYAGLAGQAIDNNTDYNVRARLVLTAINDADESKMVWEAYSVILTPDGEFDFMSAEPIKAELAMEFETPDGYDHPARLIYVEN